MNSSLSQLTPAQLRRAASLKERIDSLQRELDKLLGGTTPAQKSAKPVKKRRRVSAAARARIAAAQKKRWAKFHAAKGTASK
jgi:hypothetical protein